MWSYRKHSDVSSFCLRYVRFPWELNLDRYFTQNSNGMLDTVIVSSEKKSRCRLQEELITYVFLNMIAMSTSNAVDKRLSYQISQSETLFMILLFCQSRIMILSWDTYVLFWVSAYCPTCSGSGSIFLPAQFLRDYQCYLYCSGDFLFCKRRNID